MSGKMSEVYEAYDIEIEQILRVRGAIVLKTNKGMAQLKQLDVGEKRAFAEYQFKELLYQQGFCWIDRCIPNLDNELVTYDRYGTPYVMRKAFVGRECNINSIEDINVAAKKLAEFHLVGKEIFDSSESDVHIRLNGNFQKRNTELRRIRSYVSKRSPKRYFEEIYMDNFNYFYAQADDCEKRYGERRNGDVKRHVGYCHGMYNHHSVIMAESEKTDHEVALINFDKFYVGNQLADLYNLVRKVIEKNDYDFVYFVNIIEKYNDIIRLSREDIEYIYICLCYPEKFYKISNQYYNSSKNWISPKLISKINGVIEMEKNKLIFLEKMKDYVGKY